MSPVYIADANFTVPIDWTSTDYSTLVSNRSVLTNLLCVTHVANALNAAFFYKGAERFATISAVTSNVAAAKSR